MLFQFPVSFIHTFKANMFFLSKAIVKSRYLHVEESIVYKGITSHIPIQNRTSAIKHSKLHI